MLIWARVRKKPITVAATKLTAVSRSDIGKPVRICGTDRKANGASKNPGMDKKCRKLTKSPASS